MVCPVYLGSHSVFSAMLVNPGLIWTFRNFTIGSRVSMYIQAFAEDIWSLVMEVFMLPLDSWSGV
jgi:hypothetical protein